MRCIFVLLFLAGTLVGCQSRAESGLTSAPAEISAPTATAIADDMVTKFAEQMGPASSTIVFTTDNTAFGQALEASLTRWGYTVVTKGATQGENQTLLAFAIDTHEGNVLARLSTVSMELGRAYKATTSGASPTSPVSVMRRG